MYCLFSDKAAEADIPAAVDLMYTLKAHSDKCVGMAANMIGAKKELSYSVQTLYRLL